MTQEEVLQKVNDYCNEKSYTTATLTDDFRGKFAKHFAALYPDTAVDDETALGAMKFALNSAFSGASSIIAEKTRAFTTKENELNAQIEELKKKVTPPVTPPQLSEEVAKQLKELKAYKEDQQRQAKKATILTLAKAGVRQDLHTSFDAFATDFVARLDKEDKEQADALVNRFQEIFKASIGDIKPLAPQVSQQKDEEFISSIGKVKL